MAYACTKVPFTAFMSLSNNSPEANKASPVLIKRTERLITQ